VRWHLVASLALLAACGRFGFDAAPDAGAVDAVDATPGSYAATVMADRPRSYYRLGERNGAFLTDSAGAAHAEMEVDNGLLELGRSGALTGDSNTAVYFAGDGNLGPKTSAYARFPDVWSTWSGDFTIEVFLRPVAAPPGGWNHAILVCEDYLTSGFRTGWTTQLELAMWSDQGGAMGQLESTVSMSLGSWHHAAFIRRGTSVELYLDAVLVGSAAYDYLPPTEPADCGFGAFHGMPSDTELDELAVYDRALSQDQLAAHVAASR
jgi:hypothetical protein